MKKDQTLAITCKTCGGDGSTNGRHNGRKDEDCPDCDGTGNGRYQKD
jgi:DnaJ-class molecular chaperone